MEHLERCCQLHEYINIYYVVDGYNAQLAIQDNLRIVLEAKGETILEALSLLNEKLKDYNIQQVRKLPSKLNPNY